MSIEFNYFYGNEAEQFTFYRILELLTLLGLKLVPDNAKMML